MKITRAKDELGIIWQMDKSGEIEAKGAKSPWSYKTSKASGALKLR